MSTAVAKNSGGRKSRQKPAAESLGVPIPIVTNTPASDAQDTIQPKSSRKRKVQSTRGVDVDSEDEQCRSDTSIRSSRRRTKGKGGRVDQLTRIGELIDPVTQRSRIPLIDEELFAESQDEENTNQVTYCIPCLRII